MEIKTYSDEIIKTSKENFDRYERFFCDGIKYTLPDFSPKHLLYEMKPVTTDIGEANSGFEELMSSKLIYITNDKFQLDKSGLPIDESLSKAGYPHGIYKGFPLLYCENSHKREFRKKLIKALGVNVILKEI